MYHLFKRIMARTVILTVGLFLGLNVCAGPAGSRLFLKIFDEHGSPVQARLRIFDAQGHPLAIHSLDPPHVVTAHPNFPELGIVVPKQAQIALPDGNSTVVVERGPEYRSARLAVDSQAGKDLERSITLQRWIDMMAKGWWAGDLHVHRSPEDMPALMAAADLQFAPTITCFDDTLAPQTWPGETVFHLYGERVYSIDNCEDERRWGAALFINLQSPVKLYARNSMYPSPVQTWREARKRGAYIDLEKAIWWDAPVMAALNPPDSIGVAANHFQEDTVATRASLARPRDEAKYGGPRGFARYMFDLYATYLSAGFRIAASAGSANGVSRNMLGYDRSYVYLGSKFSYAAWLAGQKAGRNFVTNGPMLFLRVNGRMPGSVLPANAGEVGVKLDCESRSALDRAEIIADGAIAATFRGGDGALHISASTKIASRPGGWIAARCFEENPVTVRFAHTSPVYFGPTARRSPEALAYLRDWVDADMRRLEQAPSRLLTEAQKRELLGLCRKARERYQ